MTKWQLDARCAGADPRMFEDDPEDGPSLQEYRDYAKQVYCSRCPVTDFCYTTAMINGDEGVWGGTETVDREQVREDWLKNNSHLLPVPDVKRDPREERPAWESALRRYEIRLHMITEAHDHLIEDMPEGFEDHLRICKTMMDNPLDSYITLGEKIGKSPSWIKQRVQQLFKMYSVAEPN